MTFFGRFSVIWFLSSWSKYSVNIMLWMRHPVRREREREREREVDSFNYEMLFTPAQQPADWPGKKSSVPPDIIERLI